jgi:phosphoribosylaminoimidazole-succinocarboxamide synthase
VDGSSRVSQRKSHNGYSVIDVGKLETIVSGRVSNKWSAQTCELFVLKLLKDKEGTIYTDFKYEFGVVHTFGKIWAE